VPIKHTAFQFFLYKTFVLDKKYDVRETAQKIGESASTFYNYIDAVSYCPPDIIPRLYNATGDIDFLDFFVKDTDMMLSPRQGVSEVHDVIDELLDVPEAVGRLITVVRGSLSPDSPSGRKMSPAEKRDNVNAIDEAIFQLEELKASILRPKS